MPIEVIESLEILVFEAIGMTAVALATVAIGEIAQAIGMSLPSTSRLIQRLERRELVTTERDESDRRATLVRLTAKGKEVRQAVVACRREMMEAALQQHTPRLPRGLVPGLSAIATAFDQYR